MWWKNILAGFCLKSSVRVRSNQRNILLLSIVIPMLMLVGVLGTNFIKPTEPIVKQELTSANDLVLGESDIEVSFDRDSSKDIEEEQPSVSTGHEAAAGPQPEEAEPLVVVPAPVQSLPSVTKRVGIQAGHWRSWELPAELAGLRGSTGTSGGGVPEWQLNLDIARKVAPVLQAEGVEVDIIPATVPPGYRADAFVALHADGNANRQLSGFKLAHSRWSAIPQTEDALIAAITQEYQAATRLRVDPNITRNMTGYYAFNYRAFQHAIAPSTPGVIVEMGFMTNPSDLELLLRRQDVVAEGIARGILRFLNSL